MLKTTEACWTSYVPDDADGNMTAKINKQTSDTTVYTYDIENKLVQVQKTGMLARYTYDALGRRMSKDVNGVVTKFRYDGDDLIIEMDGNDSVTANYTFGGDVDEPVMMHKNQLLYFYIKDKAGSITALTNDVGSVVHEYKYSVFGKIVSESGDHVENPFTYTSRELDKETGNYYYRERYYNSQIGRFISEDPIAFSGGDVNLYRYCLNDPTNYYDPFGLKVKIKGDKYHKKYKELYEKMKKTKKGGEMCKILEDRKETYTFDRAWEDAYYNPATLEIRIDLNWSPDVETTIGPYPISNMDLLAHELGHAVGEADENINYKTSENPVRKELGEPERTKY